MSYEGYNRTTAQSYLYYCSDLHDTQGDPDHPGPNMISGYSASQMDDPHQRATLTALDEAVARLKAERWHLWMKVEPLYFRSDNNPTLLDAWRTEAANGSHADRIAVGMHEDALRFVTKTAEERVRAEGYERLFLKLPERIKGEKAGKLAAKRKEVVEVLVGCMEEHGHDNPEAIKRAARKTGYSPKQLRIMRHEIRGGT